MVLRVRASNRAPRVNSTFYVSHLGQAFDLSELEMLFTTVGDVKSMRWENIRQGSRRVGIIEMRTDQQASDCIELFNGYNFVGQRLSVSASRPKG